MGGRWEGFTDKDVVNSGRRELLEEVVNHAKDSKDNNGDNNALDLEEPKSGWAQIWYDRMVKDSQDTFLIMTVIRYMMS